LPVILPRNVRDYRQRATCVAGCAAVDRRARTSVDKVKTK
jgi:hypothetical protein